MQIKDYKQGNRIKWYWSERSTRLAKDGLETCPSDEVRGCFGFVEVIFKTWRNWIFGNDGCCAAKLMLLFQARFYRRRHRRVPIELFDKIKVDCWILKTIHYLWDLDRNGLGRPIPGKDGERPGKFPALGWLFVFPCVVFSIFLSKHLSHSFWSLISGAKTSISSATTPRQGGKRM